MVPVQNSKQTFIVFAGINASLGFFLYFYSISIFNSIQEVLQKYVFPNASLTETSLFASAPLLGGVIGALSTKAIGNLSGRRSTMIFTNIISIIGVLLTMLPNISLFILGRALCSFEGGVSIVLVNIYITEICKDPIRAQVGAIPNIAAAMGVVVAFMLGGLMPSFINSGNPYLGCRLLLGFPAFLSLIKILNLIFVFKFETPFYLVSQNKESEAKQVLELLYDDGHSAVLRDIIGEKDYINEESDISWKDIFKSKYRKALIVSLPIALNTSFMGGMSPLIFSNMVLSEGMETSYNTQTLMLTNLIAIFNLLGGLIALLVLKYNGKRRHLAIVGPSILAASNLAITLIIYFDSVSNMAVKIIIVSWTLAAGSTISPLSSFYIAEILPEIGVGIINTIGFIFGFISVQLFIYFKVTIGYAGLYLLFTCLTVISLIIIILFFVETKDKSKLEIYRLYGECSDEEENLKQKDIEEVNM